jgi:hypothetical protein
MKVSMLYIQDGDNASHLWYSVAVMDSDRRRRKSGFLIQFESRLRASKVGDFHIVTVARPRITPQPSCIFYLPPPSPYAGG